MGELELTRSPDDRRVYALEGVGTLRFEGLTSRRATAEAGGATWEIASRGRWRGVVDATDAAGTAVGTFEPRGRLRRGGTVMWGDREVELRPASRWRERYALADGERDLAVFDGKGWGKRPVAVTLDDAAEIEPGLLLFAAFVVRRMAEDAGAAAAATSA